MNSDLEPFFATIVFIAIAIGVAWLAAPGGLIRPSAQAVIVGLDSAEHQPVGDTVKIEVIDGGWRAMVYYKGGLRGELVRVNLDTKTVQVNSRPPAGWNIGGR